MRQIILASTSPRRKQLLEKMGLAFTIVPSEFEEYLDDARTPEGVAKELGLGKARAVAEKYPEAIVIGSDTIVTVRGHQLAKAANLAEAREMWQLVTSAKNKVTSSIAIVCKALDYERSDADNTFVTFKPYDEQAVEAYLATGDYADKAGAWSVQQARHLMQSIEGDEDTLMGLPTKLLARMLADLGR